MKNFVFREGTLYTAFVLERELYVLPLFLERELYILPLF
jgi:hypothetical protein